jgi:hypothetical protein
MNLLSSKKMIGVISLLIIAAVLTVLALPNDKVDFNTQVKPILNKKCISCHGGVKQKSGFSLLFEEEALGKTESGKPAIVPGHPEQSELIRRITANDPDERMPYKHAPLTSAEVDILQKWIKQGAKWGEHWAYVPVKEEPVPDHSYPWIKNDIDQFIYSKLKEEKLSPSKEAEKSTLLRRVSLDLTGMPAPENIANKFLQDNTGKAYENLVNDLLASSSYGERWTSLWLDLSRYADTKGYEKDGNRSIWKYRDWLIHAFNADKPYNDFLMEQLAGDLMPNPDDAKYIATSFHRNTMTNDEGGTDNEEFRTAAVLDRVNTTWSALMGTTFNCVQCHSHPYDPFKHDEYYKFLAFFNNSRDEDTESEYPLLRQFNSADSSKLLQVMDWVKKHTSENQAKEYYLFLKTWQPAINALQCDSVNNGSISSHASLRNNGSCRLKNVPLNNSNQLVFRYYCNYNGVKLSIHLDSLNGPLVTSHPLSESKGWKITTINISSFSGRHNLFFKTISPKSGDANAITFDWFKFTDRFPGKDKPGFELAQQQYNELLNTTAEATPVMVENSPELFRTSNVFVRGNRTVKGKEVTPDVPHVMNPMPANAPKNRLGMAMWLTDKKNPLVARTMVNRLWEQLFGYGIAETLEDMGTQGISPTHKDLLDHLSWQFANEFNWSIKKLLKEMVLSATYQQESKVTKELLQKDPNNKLYARGPRVRLSAEQIRDQALSVSHVLSNKMYGKSVMPFQPAGVWRSPYASNTWKLSEGDDQYRRAVYTFWKRSAPYPSMFTFDGGAREVCITRRIRTNTPLQALTTLNDSAYIVMARHFAHRMNELEEKDISKKIGKGYESMMYKSISENRLKALMNLYTTSFNKFKKDPMATCELLGLPDSMPNAETASLVIVASAMFNMDEWLNKN